MNEFHINEQNNEVELVGSPDMIVNRRSAIKLAQGPRIMVVIPVGGKRCNTVLECPQCKANPDVEQHKFQVDNGFEPLGLVPVEFMLQHMNWLPPLNVTMAYMYKSGMLSAAARQIMTAEAMTMETVKYIFYVDDDMIIPPMGLYTLYNFMETHPEAGAVTGVYTTRNDPPEPLIYTDHGEGASWDFELGPNANPKKIMGAGAGCLLARVEAIRDWQGANPDTATWCDSSEYPASNGGRVTWGHDVRFVRNLVEAGWPCYVDGRVLCGHYDIATRKTFVVPANAPGFGHRNINTEDYWDGVYGAEGMNSWRTYEAMYSYIVDHVRENGLMDILELGCGSGVLGQRLTATTACYWIGMDFSNVAVTQAQARYLKAFQGDVCNIDEDDSIFDDRDCLIATELLEHLSWKDCKALLGKINATNSIGQLIFATPWNCMPPSEVPEHQVQVGASWMEAVMEVLTNYKRIDFHKVDEQHVVFIFARKG